MGERTGAEKIVKTDDEWRVQLSPEQYRVTRRHGTEQPFSGEYDGCKDPGVYVCVCCGNPLFSSETKFDSGTGWPSFHTPLGAGSVETRSDWSLFMRPTPESGRIPFVRSLRSAWPSRSTPSIESAGAGSTR